MVERKTINGFQELHSSFNEVRANSHAAVPPEMMRGQSRKGNLFQVWGFVFVKENSSELVYNFQANYNAFRVPKRIEQNLDGKKILFDSPWYLYEIISPLSFVPIIGTNPATDEERLRILQNIGVKYDSKQDLAELCKKSLSDKSEEYDSMKLFFQDHPDIRQKYSSYINFSCNTFLGEERRLSVTGSKGLLVVTLKNHGEEDVFTSIEH